MVSMQPPRIGLSVPSLGLPPPSFSASYPGYVPGTQHAAGMPPIHAGMGPNQVAELVAKVDVLTKTVAHLQVELAAAHSKEAVSQMTQGFNDGWNDRNGAISVGAPSMM